MRYRELVWLFLVFLPFLSFSTTAAEDYGGIAFASKNYEGYADKDLENKTFAPSHIFSFDWVVLESPPHRSPNFIKNLNGEWYFDPEAKPKIGLVLTSGATRFVNPHRDSYPDYAQPLFNPTLIPYINRGLKILAELPTYELYAHNDYEIETLNISDVVDPVTNPQYWSLGYQRCATALEHMLDDYNIVIAPASCVIDRERRKAIGHRIFAYFQFRDIMQFVDQAYVSHFEETVSENPDFPALTTLRSRSRDVTVCATKRIDKISRDVLMLYRLDAEYEPVLFEDVNDLYIEVTQKQQHNCNVLLTTVKEKSMLRDPLTNDGFRAPDWFDFVDPEAGRPLIEFLDEYYSNVSIPERDLYYLFDQLGKDADLYKKTRESGLASVGDLNKELQFAASNVPSLQIESLSDLDVYLDLKKEARDNSISIETLIAQKQEQERLAAEQAAEQRQEAARKRAERREALNKQKAEDYPYYAEISCGFSGSASVDIRGCFAGFNSSPDTTITLRAENSTREVKHWRFNEIGNQRNNRLYIDLPETFLLRAQNASDNMTLTIKVYDRLSTEMLASDQAANQFGVATIRN